MLGDCLEMMGEIEDGSVDMICCDPPYGTTACKWDAVIPFEPMWAHVKRVLKRHKAALLFGQEPSSSLLRASNLEMFKYDWYWRKSRPSGFTNAKLKPLKDIEVVSVFSEGATANGAENNMPYFPQGLENCHQEWSRPQVYEGSDRGVSPSRKNHKLQRVIDKTGYPRQVLDFANPNKDVLHPTQKPVALCEYLIRTYTDEGEVVLDFTMGSGTTGVAALNTGRRFIGIERDESYFTIAEQRIMAAKEAADAVQA
jgi:site-specific DNA-methyltransferase (adenine-specific)